MDQEKRVLIIPRNDGIAISMDEIKGVVIVKMDAEQMFNMAHRCQQAGLEMLRMEKKNDSDKG